MSKTVAEKGTYTWEETPEIRDKVSSYLDTLNKSAGIISNPYALDAVKDVTVHLIEEHNMTSIDFEELAETTKQYENSIPQEIARGAVAAGSALAMAAIIGISTAVRYQMGNPVGIDDPLIAGSILSTVAAAPGLSLMDKLKPKYEQTELYKNAVEILGKRNLKKIYNEFNKAFLQESDSIPVGEYTLVMA